MAINIYDCLSYIFKEEEIYIRKESFNIERDKDSVALFMRGFFLEIDGNNTYDEKIKNQL